MIAETKKKRKIDGHGNVSIFYMIKNRSSINSGHRIRLRPNLLAVLLALTFASACSPQVTPTMFRPPTEPGPTQILPTTTSVPQLFTPVPTPTITLTVPGPCTDNLTFVDDATVKDGTSFAPSASIDKQWLVQNSGTCNWDSTYHLKWVGGDPLGAAEVQPLYPARAGTQVTLRILFTAPATGGPYESAWQAVDPNGNVFGDLIFIKINVIIQ